MLFRHGNTETMLDVSLRDILMPTGLYGVMHSLHCIYTLYIMCVCVVAASETYDTEGP